MIVRPTLLLAAAAAALMAGSAQAQSVMTPGAVPPPPSVRDSLRPNDGQARRGRRPAQAEREAGAESEAAAPRRRLRATTTAPSASDGGYARRVDDRPQRAPARGFQLEDDPRGVAPTFNNGRPGVGMRF